MAISHTQVKADGYVTDVFTDTGGGGGRIITRMDRFAGVAMTIQRTSGAGTYTVEGSTDGAKWGALPTALAAVADDVIHIVTGAPLYVGVTIAAAAATVTMVGYSARD